MFNVRTMAAVAAFGIAAAAAPQAHAALIIEAGGTVGPGGVITGSTVEASNSANEATSASFSFGNFDLNFDQIVGANAIGSSGILIDVGANNTSTTGAGSLSLFFIETGLTGSSPAVLSAAFTAAQLRNISITRSFYFDPTNTGAETDLLLTSSGANAEANNLSFDFDGTYALVEEIDLTATTAGASAILSGDDQVTIPEPMSLALVGGGLLGLGLIRRRK